WTFGPLRYVLASPVFHRWHHTTQEEGLNRNFAPTFPFLDLAFGTFYMPPGKLPERFGNGEPDYPEGFFGQLLRPLWMPASAAPRRRRSLAYRIAEVLAGAVVVLGVLHGAGRLADRNRPEAEGPIPAQPRLTARSDPDHVTAVLGVALSPDGSRVAGGKEDG